MIASQRRDWAQSASLDSAIYRAFGQSEVSVIYMHMNQYYVVLEFAPKYWQDPAGIEQCLFPSSGQQQPRLATCPSICIGEPS